MNRCSDCGHDLGPGPIECPCECHAKFVEGHDQLMARLGPKTWREPENIGHTETLGYVARGKAVLLSEETLPGGRFQLFAIEGGGGREFYLSGWHQDDHGNWRSQSFLTLSRAAASEFTAFCNRSESTGGR